MTPPTTAPPEPDLAAKVAAFESREVVQRTLTVVAVVVAGIALVASAIAWGFASEPGTKTTGGGAATQTVTVTLSEFKISPDMITASVGDTLKITNAGSMVHNFTIEGTPISTDPIAPGKSTTIDTSTLAAGNYTVSCNVPGHKASGMVAMLMLSAGSSTPTSVAPAAAGLTPEEQADGMTMAPAAMEAAMKSSTTAFPAKTAGIGGQDLAPTVLADGTKQFDLTAEVVDWEVSPGKKVRAWTYNGTVPGPTIRVAVGDRVTVVLHNHLPEATTLHLHGINGALADDGTPYVAQDPIEPGQSYTYHVGTATAAVGMYHSHFDAVNQVEDGMAGAILVGSMPVPATAAAQGADATHLTDQVFFLNDSGTIGLTINGKSFPATAPFVASQGQWLEVTYFNEGQMIHPMHLHEEPQLVIAQDGFPMSAAQYDDTVDVSPGQRITVLVHATDVGTWVWHCHILQHAEGPQGMFGLVTALVVKPA